jgi:hypothetical protein
VTAIIAKILIFEPILPEDEYKNAFLAVDKAQNLKLSRGKQLVVGNFVRSDLK